MKRCPADLARSLRDIVCHGKDLLGVLVEKQVVITKVTPTHVPMEILRLQIKREDIGQERTQLFRYLHHSIVVKIGWYFQRVWFTCLWQSRNILSHHFLSLTVEVLRKRQFRLIRQPISVRSMKKSEAVLPSVIRRTRR